MSFYVRGAKNAGGWPKQTKFIFDTASHRRTNKALDILEHADLHNFDVRDRTYDPADVCLDPVTHETSEIFLAAKRRVAAANDDAQREAKKLEER